MKWLLSASHRLPLLSSCSSNALALLKSTSSSLVTCIGMAKQADTTESIGSRPLHVENLLHLLGSASPQEQTALKALCRSMITIFENDPRLAYVAEAASISCVKQLNLTGLLTAFANLIAKGTSDGNIKESEVLSAFTYVLWNAKDLPITVESNLGSVLGSLAKRLKLAISLADRQTQYELVRCLSAVLDAMIELRVAGLERESIHKPLLKLLKELQESDEIRLAQAASYAYQGLLGIADDEGPWHTLWRCAWQAASVLSKTTGAITTIDPSKLLDTVPDLMSLLEGLTTLFETASGLFEAIESQDAILSLYSRQKSWYQALRYCDLFLRCKAWKLYRQVLEMIPCRNEKNFVCGVYAQIEDAWTAAEGKKDQDTKQRLIEIFRWLRNRNDHTKDALACAWASSLSSVLGEKHIAVRMSRLSLSRKTYQSNLMLLLIHYVPPVSFESCLLLKAWQDCTEAKLFYADALIRRFYDDSERLWVERLSGERLPMNKCYINLTTLHKPGKIETLGFSIKQRLQIDSHSGRNISLSNFFNSIMLPDGQEGRPKRVYIRGNAGVGKSTLCKKIVSEYLHGDLWTDLFDRILWLPLRKLKGRTYNLKSMIHQEYFGGRIEDKDLADCFARHAVNEETLFLLDGLDEVSEEWDYGSVEHTFLHELLQKSNVITTSRPVRMEDAQFDLELETIGFLPEQVETYLEHCVDKTILGRLRLFIKKNPLLQDLMRIPIQLDALCFCWEAMEMSNEPEPSTMTMLYISLTRELWRKDLHRWSNESDYQLRKLAAYEIDQHIELEQQLLEWLAFQGLINNTIEYTAKHYRFLSIGLSKIGRGMSRSHRETLETTSFLRTSEGSVAAERSYHFLHLTFQEFFAARYYVKHFLNDNDVEYLDSFASQVVNQLSPQAFLQAEKYNSRYTVFWQFVTGLIQETTAIGHCPSSSLSKFFNQLGSGPRDALEFVHHTLLMYTLSQIRPDRERSLRQRIRQELRNWVQWGISSSGNYPPEQSNRVSSGHTSGIPAQPGSVDSKYLSDRDTPETPNTS